MNKNLERSRIALTISFFQKQLMDDSCKKIFEHTWHAVLTLNSRGAITYTNPAFTEIFGYTYEEVLNRELITLFVDDSKKIIQKKLENYSRESINQEATPPAREIFSITALHQSGSLLNLELSFLPEQQNGRNNIIAFVRDLTLYKRLFRELKASRESYGALSETTSDAILQINDDFTIQFANTAIESVFGYSSNELKGGSFSLLFPPPVYKRYQSTFKKYFIIDDKHREAKSLTNVIEILGQTRKGEIIPLEISFGNSRSVAGARILTCIVRDITERKKTERKLKYLAYHDRLTDLGNRDFFNISLVNFLTLVKRSEDAMGALLFLDLDGFKKVNDTLGHNIGDMILMECARRLSNCLRESDIVYRFSDDDNYPAKSKEDLFRFGGDEFVILLTNLQKPTDAAVVAQKIIDTVKRPYFVKEYKTISRITLGVSIGIAMIPANGNDPTSLISSADVAMYKAKELGNRYMYFTQEMNTRATERLLIENGIRNALENNIFELHYQPLVADNGTIKGIEALIRWPHAERGYIPPDEFIPIAEETGLIIPLGDWVFETACRQLKKWHDHGFTDIDMSINFSLRQFNHEKIIEKLIKIIDKTGINPAKLKIEITESSIMKNPAEARAIMEKIKKNKAGIRIAIDDFGTGYSSLSHLSQFPVDIIKIDRSFVMNLNNPTNEKIINTIIALALSMDIELVAEGVETQAQFEYLSSKKCHTFQGYYFGKAVPAEQMSQLLSRGSLP